MTNGGLYRGVGLGVVCLHGFGMQIVSKHGCVCSGTGNTSARIGCRSGSTTSGSHHGGPISHLEECRSSRRPADQGPAAALSDRPAVHAAWENGPVEDFSLFAIVVVVV